MTLTVVNHNINTIHNTWRTTTDMSVLTRRNVDTIIDSTNRERLVGAMTITSTTCLRTTSIASAPTTRQLLTARLGKSALRRTVGRIYLTIIQYSSDNVRKTVGD